MNMSAKLERNGFGASKKRFHEDPYQVFLSFRFLVWSFLVSMFVAYVMGRIGRFWLLNHMQALMSPTVEVKQAFRRPDLLPSPILPQGKKMPNAVYASKHFNTGHSVINNAMLVERTCEIELEESANKEEGEDRINSTGTEENKEEIHEPAGQHLLIDIEYVDAVFLDSEERLAQAMLDLVNLSGLTLLSYHCHGLEPMGVSCIGVLLESHVSFHTWPIEGVITLDLFTCGSSPLPPLIPTIQELFAIPRSPSNEGDMVEQPKMMWAHKKRGFRRRQENVDPEHVDMDQYLLGWRDFDMKTHVASVETVFQTIEIYDIIDTRFRTSEQYEKSLVDDGSYESRHPELFEPDRVVYLDGVMQSRLKGEAAYHEALVHPALFSHDNPKRVAIIGGGEGATLREVLKHNTVEKATMIEIDEAMVNTSRMYLPQWSDCSKIVGSAASCFDDPRAEVLYLDAVGWFLDHYEDTNNIAEADKYDVIIMDAL